jgi:hypothetical protein
MNITSEGFDILTKISSSTVGRMKKLENSLATSSKSTNGTGAAASKARNVNLKAIQPALKSNEIKTTLEKPKPVSLVNVSKEALDDLKGIISKEAVDSVEGVTPKGKKPISTVAKYIAAAAATYAILSNFKLENIPGLIQGLQGARRQILKLKKRAGRAFKSIKNAAKRLIPKNLRATLRTNFNSFRKSAVDSIKSARQRVVSGIKNMGTKIATFGKGLGKTVLEKLTKNFNTFKNAAVGLVRSAKNAAVGAVDNVATSVARASSGIAASATPSRGSTPRAPAAAPKPRNIFQRATGFVADKASSAFKATKSAVGSAVSTVRTAGAGLVDDAVRVGGKVGGAIKTGATAVGNAAVKAGKFAVKQGVRAIGGVGAVAKGLLKSPLLAPIVESIFSYMDIKKAIDEYNKGELDKKQLDKKVGKRAIEGVGGIAGGLLGAGLGAAALGTLSFGLAAPLGAIIGGIGGDMAGRFLGGVVSDVVGDKTEVVGAGLLRSKLFKNKLQEHQSQENASGESMEKAKEPIEIEDGIITKTGQLIKPHAQDFIYAMKEGGPLTDAMGSDNIIAKKTLVLMEQANTISKNLLTNQTKILTENTKLLKQFLDKESTNNNNIVSSSSSTTNINYKSSGLRELQLKYV